MYLGQCLQMQSNIQDGMKVCLQPLISNFGAIADSYQTALVPYRQCKLTELLFSNSFPSPHQMSRGQYPQKAIMIVTADPLGDFNATSQILRYSALAREVTVPRAPSITESIISASGSHRSVSGRASVHDGMAEELERAAGEITRLTRDCHGLAVKLAEEEIARSELEVRLSATEERCLMIEQDVREECWAEMDEKMEEERRRWQNAWDEQVGGRQEFDMFYTNNSQLGRNDEHIDKKVELVSRGFQSKFLLSEFQTRTIILTFSYSL